MKKKVLILIAVVFMCSVCFGCATSKQFKDLEAKVKTATEKGDKGITDAAAAKKVADDCCGKTDKAVKDANAAAARAEAAATKAEAVFKKSMKK